MASTPTHAEQTTQPAARRRWPRFRLRTLLLLPATVLGVFAVGPLLYEEFHPIDKDMVLLDWEDSTHYGDEHGGIRGCSIRLNTASDEIYDLRLGYMLDDQQVEMCRFKSNLQLLGHNKKCSVLISFRDGKLRIGNNQQGWHEQTVFPTAEGEPKWRLVRSHWRNRRWSLGCRLGTWEQELEFECCLFTVTTLCNAKGSTCGWMFSQK